MRTGSQQGFATRVLPGSIAADSATRADESYRATWMRMTRIIGASEVAAHDDLCVDGHGSSSDTLLIAWAVASNAQMGSPSSLRRVLLNIRSGR